ncbi:universal stress protein [Paenibacillus sp. TRM 82003]|nr:universal stress protein [Paenibacillus sp. TRM 82003]
MGFRHLLVAYDGSEASVRGLERAIELSRCFPDAKISVLHICTVQSMVVGDAYVGRPTQVQARWYLHADRIVEDAESRVRAIPGATVEMRQGVAPREILAYAEANGCDLIVMGNRGFGTFRELLLGSVSHNVVQHANVPVLIVK